MNRKKKQEFSRFRSCIYISLTVYGSNRFKLIKLDRRTSLLMQLSQISFQCLNCMRMMIFFHTGICYCKKNLN